MTNKKTFKTTCCYCGVGCGMLITESADGKIHVAGDPEHPSNRGLLCSKGMNLHYTAWDKTDRLTHPEMRWNKSMPRQRVSWEIALERTAAVFKTFIERFGPDSVGFYVSGQLLTEEYYVVNKLIKGFIGSNNIDTNSRLCMSSAVAGYKLALGEDSVPVCYDDIELSDCILVAGANPAWCHPIIWRRVEAHKVARPNVKIITIDPRRTDTAKSSDLHLQIKPGTDITLFNAIARILIENVWIDNDFLTQHTEGYEKLKQIAFEKSVEESALICGISTADLCSSAEMIGKSKAFLSMWAMGLNQSVVGVSKNLSLINLHLLTGQIGKPGAGPFSLTGQPNAMGGREVGGLSNMLPAHRNLLDEEERREVERFWQQNDRTHVVTISPKPGLTATEMFEALADGRMKAIWIICTNPLVSLPDVRMAEKALKNARFVVVQDISNKPETLEYADVVLPAATWAEKEGTMTNSERRISYLHKISEPPGEALSDAEILTRFAAKMGFEKYFSGFTDDRLSDFRLTDDRITEKSLKLSLSQSSVSPLSFSPESIFIEHAELTRGTHIDISGLNYEVLKKYGTVQWSTPEAMQTFLSTGKSTPQRLFENKKFYTLTGKAQIHACSDENFGREAMNNISTHYPLVLTTGRIRDQWHTMSRTGKVNKLKQHISEIFLEINPKDALERNISQDEIVEIKSVRGNVRARVVITEDIRVGVVFMPMHWGKIDGQDFARVNNLTNNLVDPRSKEPDFKFTPVEVTKIVQTKPRKFVIVGAGAAAFGFIETYRRLNAQDEIHIFSREMHPFYNRVMLPDYVSGTQTWEQLQKLTERDFFEKKLTVHCGVGIEKLNTQQKILVDTNGITHNYDVLILGTGSRPFLPKDVPAHLGGVFTMRTKYDADNLLETLSGRDAIPRASKEDARYRVSTNFFESDNLKPKIQNPKSIVVVGGGLLGLEMAASLREMGMTVTVVQRISRLMDRQLDILGSQLLLEEIKERDIEIFMNDEVQTFFGREKVEAVRLRSGRKIECDAVVYAVGTIPNGELARTAGLSCNRGVIVNDYLQTNDPNIFALGEIAEWRGQMWGITAAAEQQAAVAARFLAGDAAKPYNGSLSMNILKMEGLQLCSLGRIETPEEDVNFEEVIFVDKAKRYYKKCLIHNDKLVGAILIGDKREFVEFKNLIENGIELSEKRLQLLRSSGKVEPVIGKLVCSCNGVGAGNLEKVIENGCTQFEKLCDTTGAGKGCGSCRTEVKMLLLNYELRMADLNPKFKIQNRHHV